MADCWRIASWWESLIQVLEGEADQAAYPAEVGREGERDAGEGVLLQAPDRRTTGAVHADDARRGTASSAGDEKRLRGGAYLAYQGHSRQNLTRYAARCPAECLHGAPRSWGFDPEDTGPTTARVSTLLMEVSTAFVWVCLTGEMQASGVAVEVKKHGDGAVSVFRLCSDALQDVRRWSSLPFWSGMIGPLARFAPQRAPCPGLRAGIGPQPGLNEMSNHISKDILCRYNACRRRNCARSSNDGCL